MSDEATESNLRELGRHVRALDFDEIQGLIRFELEMGLSRHPQVGPALSFAQGEALISSLSATIAVTVHRQVDPEYGA